MNAAPRHGVPPYDGRSGATSCAVSVCASSVPEALKLAAGFACSVHIGMHECASGFMVEPGVVLTCASWLKNRARETAFMFTVPGVAAPFHDGPDETRTCLTFASPYPPDVAIVLGTALARLYRLICKRAKCPGNPAMSGGAISCPAAHSGDAGSNVAAVHRLAVVHNPVRTACAHGPVVSWCDAEWGHRLPKPLADACRPSSVGAPVLHVSSQGVRLVGLVTSKGYSYVHRDCIDLLLKYVGVQQVVAQLDRALTLPSLTTDQRAQMSERKQRLVRALAKVKWPGGADDEESEVASGPAGRAHTASVQSTQ
jgi:hypothetical protein